MTDQLKEKLIDIGFQELPHFTIVNNLIYDLGRNRHLSFGAIGTPNEMLFIFKDYYCVIIFSKFDN